MLGILRKSFFCVILCFINVQQILTIFAIIMLFSQEYQSVFLNWKLCCCVPFITFAVILIHNESIKEHVVAMRTTVKIQLPLWWCKILLVLVTMETLIYCWHWNFEDWMFAKITYCINVAMALPVAASLLFAMPCLI